MIRALGPSTMAAIEGFRRDGELPSSGGATNGAAMRALPVGWVIPLAQDERRRRFHGLDVTKAWVENGRDVSWVFLFDNADEADLSGIAGKVYDYIATGGWIWRRLLTGFAYVEEINKRGRGRQAAPCSGH